MMFSPGTWTTVDNLKMESESFCESFCTFLDSDICPSSVKIVLKFAKVHYDKKNTRRNVAFKVNFDFQSVISKFSQSSQELQEDLTFGNQLLHDIVQLKCNVEEAESDDEVLFNDGEDFNGHTHGLEYLLGFPEENLDYEEIEQWLPTVSEEELATFKRDGNNLALYDVNPRLVNKL